MRRRPSIDPDHLVLSPSLISLPPLPARFARAVFFAAFHPRVDISQSFGPHIICSLSLCACRTDLFSFALDINNNAIDYDYTRSSSVC